jgi:hypothetical protein
MIAYWFDRAVSAVGVSESCTCTLNGFDEPPSRQGPVIVPVDAPIVYPVGSEYPLATLHVYGACPPLGDTVCE